MKILLVEDDLTSRMFMEKYLSRYGEIEIATNGLEAIEMVEGKTTSHESYDLICMDVMMPKIDGLKALKAIKAIEKKFKVKTSKVIMTTALNDNSTVSEAYALGCHAYAWKPIDIKAFDLILKDLDLIK